MICSFISGWVSSGSLRMMAWTVAEEMAINPSLFTKYRAMAIAPRMRLFKMSLIVTFWLVS